MCDKKMFVLKIVWRKSIASLHRLTQDVQCANLRSTAGDPTWVTIQIDRLGRYDILYPQFNIPIQIILVPTQVKMMDYFVQGGQILFVMIFKKILY